MFDVKRGPFEGSEWFMINLGLSRGQKVWHRGVRTFDVEFIISKREEAREEVRPQTEGIPGKLESGFVFNYNPITKIVVF